MGYKVTVKNDPFRLSDDGAYIVMPVEMANKDPNANETYPQIVRVPMGATIEQVTATAEAQAGMLLEPLLKYQEEYGSLRGQVIADFDTYQEWVDWQNGQ